MSTYPNPYGPRKTNGSTTTTAQQSPFRTDMFGHDGSASYGAASNGYSSRASSDHNGLHRSFDMQKPTLAPSNSDPSMFSPEYGYVPAIVIRRLPRNISMEAVESMLLFSESVIGIDFVQSPSLDEQDFTTAVAHFRDHKDAQEAQKKLHGKPNMTRDTNMIVEIHNGGMTGSMERRATIGGMTSRQQTASTSSSGSSRGPPTSGRSRYNSTFQSTEKTSPPLPAPGAHSNGRDARLQNLFSPKSPLTNNGYNDRNRISGKSLINSSVADQDTQDLLQNPLGYATSERRATKPQLPLMSRFNSLSISTNYNDGFNSMFSPSSSISSPHGPPAITSPLSPTNITGMGPNGFMANKGRQLPPVNPADQNPPCNTLYVGNLPIEASEDEIKAIFTKQRGYKRMCYRAKNNGPMCFVEFEDVSFATKALSDLYGVCLSNSTKGGIRLSFSKNPLGVRSSPGMNGMNGNQSYVQNSMAPAYVNGNNGVNASGYSAVSGPPPGLASPPGLLNGHAQSFRAPPVQYNGQNEMFANPFGLQQQNMQGSMQPQQQTFVNQLGSPLSNNFSNKQPANLSGGIPPNVNGHYGRDSRDGQDDYGRDSRGSYDDYMLGR